MNLQISQPSKILSSLIILAGPLVLVLVGILFPWKSLEAETEERGKRGLKFNVPEDWPIEKRGMHVGPVPIEEYLDLKFKKIDTRFSEMETTFDGKLADMNLQLETLENGDSDIEERLSDLENWLKKGQARRSD